MKTHNTSYTSTSGTIWAASLTHCTPDARDAFAQLYDVQDGDDDAILMKMVTMLRLSKHPSYEELTRAAKRKDQPHPQWDEANKKLESLLLFARQHPLLSGNNFVGPIKYSEVAKLTSIRPGKLLKLYLTAIALGFDEGFAYFPLLQWYEEKGPVSVRKVRVATIEVRNTHFVKRNRNTSEISIGPWDDTHILAEDIDGEPAFLRRLQNSNTPLVKRCRPDLFTPPEYFQLPVDNKLLACVSMAGTARKGDRSALYFLLSLIHSSLSPMIGSVHDWARLISRSETTASGYRTPKPSDMKRLERLAKMLAFFGWEETTASGFTGWVRGIWYDFNPETETLMMGAPGWIRQRINKRFTLTGVGGCDTRNRLAASQSAAGMLIDGLETYLYTAWKRQLGTGTGIFVRPATGKTGPGQMVELTLREALWLTGDVFEPTRSEYNSARKRFGRMLSRLETMGYFLPQGGTEAPAGDSLEIIDVTRGRRGAEATLRFRASARFVEAARKAYESTKRPDTSQINTVSLTKLLQVPRNTS